MRYVWIPLIFAILGQLLPGLARAQVFDNILTLEYALKHYEIEGGNFYSRSLNKLVGCRYPTDHIEIGLYNPQTGSTKTSDAKLMVRKGPSKSFTCMRLFDDGKSLLVVAHDQVPPNKQVYKVDLESGIWELVLDLKDPGTSFSFSDDGRYYILHEPVGDGAARVTQRLVDTKTKQSLVTWDMLPENEAFPVLKDYPTGPSGPRTPPSSRTTILKKNVSMIPAADSFRTILESRFFENPLRVFFIEQDTYLLHRYSLKMLDVATGKVTELISSQDEFLKFLPRSFEQPGEVALVSGVDLGKKARIVAFDAATRKETRSVMVDHDIQYATYSPEKPPRIVFVAAKGNRIEVIALDGFTGKIAEQFSYDSQEATKRRNRYGSEVSADGSLLIRKEAYALVRIGENSGRTERISLAVKQFQDIMSQPMLSDEQAELAVRIFFKDRELAPEATKVIVTNPSLRIAVDWLAAFAKDPFAFTHAAITPVIAREYYAKVLASAHAKELKTGKREEFTSQEVEMILNGLKLKMDIVTPYTMTFPQDKNLVDDLAWLLRRSKDGVSANQVRGYRIIMNPIKPEALLGKENLTDAEHLILAGHLVEVSDNEDRPNVLPDVDRMLTTLKRADKNPSTITSKDLLIDLHPSSTYYNTLIEHLRSPEAKGAPNFHPSAEEFAAVTKTGLSQKSAESVVFMIRRMPDDGNLGAVQYLNAASLHPLKYDALRALTLKYPNVADNEWLALTRTFDFEKGAPGTKTRPFLEQLTGKISLKGMTAAELRKFKKLYPVPDKYDKKDKADTRAWIRGRVLAGVDGLSNVDKIALMQALLDYENLPDTTDVTELLEKAMKKIKIALTNPSQLTAEEMRFDEGSTHYYGMMLKVARTPEVDRGSKLVKLAPGEVSKNANVDPLFKEHKYVPTFNPTKEDGQLFVQRLLKVGDASEEDIKNAAWFLGRAQVELKPEILAQFNVPDLKAKVVKFTHENQMSYKDGPELAGILIIKSLLEDYDVSDSVCTPVKDNPALEKSRDPNVDEAILWLANYQDMANMDRAFYARIVSRFFEKFGNNLCPVVKKNLLIAMTAAAANNAEVHHELVCSFASTIAATHPDERLQVDATLLNRAIGAQAILRASWLEEMRAWFELQGRDEDIYTTLVNYALGQEEGAIYTRKTNVRVQVQSTAPVPGAFVHLCAVRAKRPDLQGAIDSFMKKVYDGLDENRPRYVGFVPDERNNHAPAVLPGLTIRTQLMSNSSSGDIAAIESYKSKSTVCTGLPQSAAPEPVTAPRPASPPIPKKESTSKKASPPAKDDKDPWKLRGRRKK